jgi:hypothetical protein
MSGYTNVASWKVKPLQLSLLYQLMLKDIQVYWDVRLCESMKRLLTPSSRYNNFEVVDLVQDTYTHFHITNLLISTSPYPIIH